MVDPVPRRLPIGALLVALATLAGCVGLTPAAVPNAVLDVGSGNGWTRDDPNTSGVEGGFLTKQATNAYVFDPVSDDRFPGTLRVVSIATLLSPDREELLDRLEQQLVQQAGEQGLELEDQIMRGERQLSSGAQSFFVTFNGTARAGGSLFASDSTVKVIGEVFRCTGGPTVVATGSAQVEGTRSVGGITTERQYDTRTWSDVVEDPQGTVEGFRGSAGLIHNVECP